MEETVINRFLTVFTDISVKTGFWRHKPNPIYRIYSVSIFDLFTSATNSANAPDGSAMMQQYTCILTHTC